MNLCVSVLLWLDVSLMSPFTSSACVPTPHWWSWAFMLMTECAVALLNKIFTSFLKPTHVSRLLSWRLRGVIRWSSEINRLKRLFECSSDTLRLFLFPQHVAVHSFIFTSATPNFMKMQRHMWAHGSCFQEHAPCLSSPDWKKTDKEKSSSSLWGLKTSGRSTVEVFLHLNSLLCFPCAAGFLF